MKKYYFALLSMAVALMSLSSCSDVQNVIDDTTIVSQKTDSTQIVSLQLNATLNQPQTRGIRFSTNQKGYPKIKDFKEGDNIPVLCIFRSDDPSQPITKQVINWRVKDKKKLHLELDQRIKLKGDLNKGTWHVMGIMVDGMSDKGNANLDKLEIPRYMWRKKLGEEIDAKVPLMFTWRKLNYEKERKVFRNSKAVVFKPLGTFVWLKITNNTGFDIKYLGVRCISSSPLEGYLDISDNAIKATDIAEKDNLQPNDPQFYNFLPFKATSANAKDRQRIGRHGGYTGRNQTSSLYYNDMILGGGFKDIKNNESDDQYICLWMMPQHQTISVYNTSEDIEGKNQTGELHKVMKTQFLLIATPQNNSDPAINMIPVFGTREEFKSGEFRPVLKGSVQFRHTPLHYVAKMDNLDFDEKSYKDEDAYYSNTKYYTLEEMQDAVKNKKYPEGYTMPGRGFWQSIFAPFCFGGLGRKNIYWDYCCSMVPTLFGKKGTYYNAYSAGKFLERGMNNETGAYAICMSTAPEFATNPQQGHIYRGAHIKKNSVQFNPYWIYKNQNTFNPNTYPITKTNEWQYAIRVKVENRGNEKGRAKFEARYLGEQFVLDIADISEEMFWEKSGIQTYQGFKQDIHRYFPYAGNFHIMKDKTHYDFSNKGYCTQYWINEKVVNQDVSNPFSTIKHGDNPYHSLTIQGEGEIVDNKLSNSDGYGTSGYYFVITKSDQYTTKAKENIKTKIPIRLIRKSPLND